MSDVVSYLPSMGRMLFSLSDSACGLAEAYLRPHNVSLAQWVVLSALWRKDRLSVSVLADYSGKKTAALSRLLDRMEGRGLVKRVAVDGDKRSVEIHLTEEGHALSPLIDMYKHVNTVLLADFTPQEQSQLVSMLERMSANAKAGSLSQGESR